MIHGLRIKDGNATYVSRYVRTSRLKQEEALGGAKFQKVYISSYMNFKFCFLCLSKDFHPCKSSVNVIDAKTMSADPVAVVELPSRVPYGLHALFVTEVRLLIVSLQLHACRIISETIYK
ncbi:hypothetical protein POM88_053476 [Heracleum sosnowskyi]|uniref:carotenoid 9,10-dioxygenase n=1 Tax=Heracleum sosnowskyi TaxID=360622 RepID=A0AAD8GPS4_9APIA|nr:hypothetical protein POM88_053476 [Heracleum sosnowskyi]